MLTIFIQIVLLALLHSSYSIQLTAQVCNATFPFGINSATAAYPGNGDYIYIFRGLVSRNSSNAIFRYSITLDEIQQVAEFPEMDSYIGVTATGNDGSIYYVIGEEQNIFRFDTNTSTISNETVQLPFSGVHYPPTISVQRPGSLSTYIYGAINSQYHETEILRFNPADGATVVGKYAPLTIPNPYRAIGAIHGEEDAHVFYTASYSQLYYWYSICPYDSSWEWTLNEYTTIPTNLRDAQLFGTEEHPGVAYILANQGTRSVLLKYDVYTNLTEFLDVSGLPTDGDGANYFRNTAIVYVSSLHRMYLFGGQTITGNSEIYNKIWYIDLDRRTTVEPTMETTTEEGESTTESGAETTTIENELETTTRENIPETTTTKVSSTPTVDPGQPELFDCQGRPNGWYPDPEGCEGYINCWDGTLQRFRCPAPLLFDPMLTTCTFPEIFQCPLTCEGIDNGLHLHSYYCYLHLACLEGVMHVFSCPEPLLFDSIGNRCELPWLVDCEGRINRTVESAF